MPRYALTIAYDGTDFCGWQKQEPLLEHAVGTGSMKHTDESLSAGEPGRVALRTVQAVVELAVRGVVREEVDVYGASRTDSGVHAHGQVAAFTTTHEPALMEKGMGWPIERGTDALLRAINGRLPEDVLVTGARLVPDSFEPVQDCVRKAYSYTIHASRTRPLRDRRYVHQVWEPLDLDLMRQAASRLVGEHDFAGFAAAGHGRQSTVRTIHSCTVTDITDAERFSPEFSTRWADSVSDAPPPAEPAIDAPIMTSATSSIVSPARRYRIDVVGSGFLWNMVRIIAGTIADAGRGRRTIADIDAALSTGDRTKAGPTFPASGLCLEWIEYRHATPSIVP